MVGWPRLVLFLALLVPAFSGCLTGDDLDLEAASGSRASEEPPSSVTVTAAPGVVTAVNKGVIVGRVADDSNLSVPDADVLILQTNYLAATDGDGGFRFENVTPGSYIVRVEASGYHAAEQPIEVRAANVTNVLVTLLPLEERGAGYRPHTHDLWGDALEYVLLDRDVEYRGPISQGNENPYVDKVLGSLYYANVNSTNAFYRIPFQELGERPSIVLPGTRQIRVTVSWTAPTGSTQERMGMGYATPLKPSEIIILPKRANNDPFVFAIQPEAADSGHQRFSLWSFYLIPQNDVRNAPNDRPAHNLGTFHVKIVLVKGDTIPVDPAHEDFWGGETSLTLRARDYQPHTGSTARPTFLLQGRNLVPPGTQLLRVSIWWGYGDAANGTAADRDYAMTWRTADMSPQSGPEAYKTGPPKVDGDHFKVWEIPVKPSETDAFYQSRSNWAWRVGVEGYEREWYNPEPRTRTLRIEVIAYQDPTFNAGAS